MTELPSLPTDEERFALEVRRWGNRRRMAWLSLLFLVVTGLWAMFIADAPRLEAISPILQSVIYATASVVGVYMGLSTWAEKR